jgi:hypothetical protein
LKRKDSSVTSSNLSAASLRQTDVCGILEFLLLSLLLLNFSHLSASLSRVVDFQAGSFFC